MVMEAVADEGSFLFTETQLQEHLKQKRSQALWKWRCHSSQSRKCIIIVLLISLVTYWLYLLNPKSSTYPLFSSSSSNPKSGHDTVRKRISTETSKMPSARRLSFSSFHGKKDIDLFLNKS